MLVSLLPEISGTGGGEKTTGSADATGQHLVLLPEMLAPTYPSTVSVSTERPNLVAVTTDGAADDGEARLHHLQRLYRGGVGRAQAVTGFLRRLWRASPVATSVLGFALVVTVFFSVRLVAAWIYWSDPSHRDQAIAGWMTPRYVATSWHVPPEVVGDALGLAVERPRRLTLDQLAKERGVPLSDLTAALAAAISAHRAAE